MAAIPNKIVARIISNIKNIQRRIEKAKERDISESQTISGVVKPFLIDILGYDEFEDLTDQYCVKGTFCDLAIKVNDKPYIMIEAKAINVELKAAHAKQAKDYGINSGVKWILLTNGDEWQIYKIIFKKDGVSEELVERLKISEINPKKNEEDLKKVFYLCKESIAKSDIENLYAEKVATNKYIIGNLLFKRDTMQTIRKELKKMFPDISVGLDVVESMLRDGVIRREIVESPEATEAQRQIRKAERKEERNKTRQGQQEYEPDNGNDFGSGIQEIDQESHKMFDLLTAND